MCAAAAAALFFLAFCASAAPHPRDRTRQVGYILYDTSLIMHHLGPDDYIIGAVTLYLDIINLFLYLLELLRMLQGGDN